MKKDHMHGVSLENSATFGHAQRAAREAADIAKYGFVRPEKYVTAPGPTALERTGAMLANALRRLV